MNIIQEKKATNLRSGKADYDVLILDHYLLFTVELT